MVRVVFFSFFCVLGAIRVHAQTPAPAPPAPPEDTVKPYLKNPNLPAFNVRLMDSVTIFNTFNIPGGKPIAIVFFDPGCKHCKHSIGGMLQNMELVKDVQFYFVTPVHDMTPVRDFYAEYHMADYENIKLVGRDYEFYFFSFFKTRFLPDLALYDGHKKLIKLIEGEFTANAIAEALQEKK